VEDAGLGACAGMLGPVGSDRDGVAWTCQICVGHMCAGTHIFNFRSGATHIVRDFQYLENTRSPQRLFQQH
jgi:hypothetical protein